MLDRKENEKVSQHPKPDWGTGKSTGIALCAIGDALKWRGREVIARDHIYIAGKCGGHMATVLHDLAMRLDLELEIKEYGDYATVKSTWMLEGDHNE